MTKRQIGEEIVYLAYISALLFVNEGSCDRNSKMAGSWNVRSKQRSLRGISY